MNVNGVSGVSNNLNANGLKKVNNQPSFGALRADAADVFIKAAEPYLNQKNQNTVLQQVIRLAERAKQSLVLDIITTKDGCLRFSDVVHKQTASVGILEKIEDIIGDQPVVIAKHIGLAPAHLADLTKTGDEANQILSNKFGFKLDAKGCVSSPIDKLVDYIIHVFDEQEAKIVDQIETEKTKEMLSEKLKSLVVEEF